MCKVSGLAWCNMPDVTQRVTRISESVGSALTILFYGVNHKPCTYRIYFYMIIKSILKHFMNITYRNSQRNNKETTIKQNGLTSDSDFFTLVTQQVL